ncbi:unnamed protein product, partial [Pylaiella littoralis]
HRREARTWERPDTIQPRVSPTAPHSVVLRFSMSSPAGSDADVQGVTRAEFELQVQAGENERSHLSAEVADLQNSLEAKLATVLTTLQQVQQMRQGGAHGGTQVAGHAGGGAGAAAVLAGGAFGG